MTALRRVVGAALAAFALVVAIARAEEPSDSQRHGRLCLAAMEVDNFNDADFWCVRAAQDFALMAAAIREGPEYDAVRLAEAGYLGKVALANRTLDRERTVRFIQRTTAVFADVIKHGSTAEMRRAAAKAYTDWVREMKS